MGSDGHEDGIEGGNMGYGVGWEWKGMYEVLKPNRYIL